MTATRVKTGWYQEADGQWWVSVDINGDLHRHGPTESNEEGYATEGDAQTAAITTAAKIRTALASNGLIYEAAP